mgnify:CR=1 FL=1
MEKKHLSLVMITFFILTMLVLIGSANAYFFSATISDDSVNQGADVVFNANVDIGDDEFVNVEKVTFGISGLSSLSCVFDVLGNEISGCDDLEIELLSIPDYGYGYGYGYNDGNLTYKITLRTDNLEVGNYSTEFVFEISENQVPYGGPNFEILEDQVMICHIPPGNPNNAHTIIVGANAVNAHLAHGDYLGECISNNRNNGRGHN